MRTVLFSAITVLALGMATSAVLAQDEGSAPAADAATAAGVSVTVTGENYNLVSTLCPDSEGAEGFAGINAIKVTEATDADGTVLEAWAGKTLHYLPTTSAADLMASDAHAGKTVTVTGTVFADANALLVESFELAEAAESLDLWDELPVGTMTKQQVL